MVAQLESLRVTADFDASGYKRGMDQKVAADQAGTASASALGAALAKQDVAADNTAGAFGRMSRTYIDGYGNASKFYGALANLQRLMETGNVTAERAILEYQGMVAKHGLLASSADVAASGNAQLAAVIEQVNAAANPAARAEAEMAAQAAALRAQLDPLGAATQKMEAEIAGYTALLKKGAITETEFGQAQALAAERYNQSVQRIKGLNAQGTFIGAGNAAKLSAFQIQNLSFQMQDVGQALLTGQPLFRTFIQQGSQIAQIFGPGVGVAGALKAVGQGVIQYLTNPLNIAFLGIAGLAAGVGAFFALIRSGGSASEEVLKKHEAEIKAIKDAWSSAAEGPAKYSEAVQEAIRYHGEADMKALTDLLDSQTSKISKRLSQSPTEALGGAISAIFANSTAIANAYESVYGAAAPAVQKFVASVKGGTPDIEALNTAIIKLTRTKWDDPNTRSLVDWLVGLGQNASDTQKKIKELNDELLKTSLISARSREGEAAFKAMNETANQLRDMRDQQAAALQGVYARSPAEKAAAASAAVLAEPQDFAKDPTGAVRALKAQQAAELALANAEYALSEAQRDRKLSLDAAVLSAQQDFDLVGKSIGEQKALSTQYQLVAAIRMEAAKNGVAVDEAEIESIKRKTALIGAYAQKLAETNALREARFAREQIGRTSDEQAIATQMRTLHGDDYKSFMDSQIAQEMRFNQQLQFTKDTFSGFLSDMKSGIESGKTFWESMANAAANALNKISDKLFDLATNQLFNALFNPGAGVGLFGGGRGGLLGGAIIPGLLAKGGAFDAAGVIPFARGDVVDRPTFFRFASGTGIMGEAGPEAIMPLKRGPDGSLGVRAPANSNSRPAITVQIINQVDATGADAAAVDRLTKGLAQINKSVEQRAIAAIAKYQQQVA